MLLWTRYTYEVDRMALSEGKIILLTLIGRLQRRVGGMSLIHKDGNTTDNSDSNLGKIYNTFKSQNGIEDHCICSISRQLTEGKMKRENILQEEIMNNIPKYSLGWQGVSCRIHKNFLNPSKNMSIQKQPLLLQNKSRILVSQCCFFSSKKPEYPPIDESELEETFVRGTGPGGQNVNKLANCVMLRHLPTGVIIKCHEDRSLDKNRKTARLRMQERLDWFHNRENSFKEQQKREAGQKRQEKKKRTNKRLEKLKAFKEREGLD